ncbi:hypothetical protein HDG34_002807 [Paraburkholderia sp. HC6.4b]|uniref:hypothetical protein n=1 Tax=unclassified Paraburkholderia TaxID=2615204 RepID=UPI001612043E|nr:MULTISPECIES: hypothetical protein [unclassified Paraburkholderia]MBB5408870.1 hypothetical protein [Paraburkholderia sp. HC6.4b]MBB5450598.1 hypothetical protein [Paraburkholderia sp. Kb1A]
MKRKKIIAVTSPMYEALFGEDSNSDLPAENKPATEGFPINAVVSPNCEEYCGEDNDNNDGPFEKKPRSLAEISEVIKMLRKQIWYNVNYLNLRESIKEGEIQVLSDTEWHAIKYPENLDYISDERWASAQRAAQKIEEEIGAENLVVIDDIDLENLNGKLSALRYACGEEWEHLYA